MRFVKSMVIIAGVLLGTLHYANAQSYRTVTINEIQFISPDSLRVADSLQISQPSRFRIQASSFFTAATRETVFVIAQVVVPPRVITYNASGWNLILRDTSSTDSTWGGVYTTVNQSLYSDTVALVNNGFLNLEIGDVIKLPVFVSEFPTDRFNSATQLVIATSVPIELVDVGQPIPPPARLKVTDFYKGLYPGGTINFSTGEKFEGMYVELTGLTVASRDSSSSTGATNIHMVDDEGNMISTYDVSKWFSWRFGLTRGIPYRDPSSTFNLPAVGARIDTLRGYVWTMSGQNNNRGYLISPMFPGDLRLGVVYPRILSHRRDSVIVKDSARVSVRAYAQFGGEPLTGVYLHYRVDSGSWIDDSIKTAQPDSIYAFTIPAQIPGSLVEYFFEAIDQAQLRSIYANAGSGGISSDTSKGFFFYNVLNRPITIRDIQYTPYANGRSGYVGANGTISGIVTADTSSMGLNPLNTGGTHAFYMQTNGEKEWAGVWFTGTHPSLLSIQNGDSISVTGTIAENFDVTRIENVNTPVVIHSQGNPVPFAHVLNTGNFGVQYGNGAPNAEKYEGMLVRFNNVRVSNVYPIFSDDTEFEVDDGTGAIIVRRDGTHNFSNKPADTLLGKTILNVGDNISYLQGILYYSFSRYKIVPRSSADFGVITDVIDERQDIPMKFTLSQNYPNPFNPVTTIEYGLPEASFVSLKVYNILGQTVATLVSETKNAGFHTVRFDASKLPSGMYIYSINAGGRQISQRMVLMK